MRPANDPMEEWLRDAFSRCPRRQPPPTLAEDVLDLVSARQPVRVHRCRMTRVVLTAHWTVAASASCWVLWSIPWPLWTMTIAWGAAWLAIPLVYAVSLWPHRVLAWIAVCAAVFLTPAPRRAV